MSPDACPVDIGCPQRCSTLFNALGIIASQFLAAAVGIVLCYPDLWQVIGHLLDLSFPIVMANLFKLIEFRITMKQLLGMSVRDILMRLRNKDSF